MLFFKRWIPAGTCSLLPVDVRRLFHGSCPTQKNLRQVPPEMRECHLPPPIANPWSFGNNKRASSFSRSITPTLLFPVSPESASLCWYPCITFHLRMCSRWKRSLCYSPESHPQWVLLQLQVCEMCLRYMLSKFHLSVCKKKKIPLCASVYKRSGSHERVSDWICQPPQNSLLVSFFYHTTPTTSLWNITYQQNLFTLCIQSLNDSVKKILANVWVTSLSSFTCM